MIVNLATVGLGRIGAIHALHTRDVAREEGCKLVAVVDIDIEKARRVAADLSTGGPEILAFESVDDLCAAGLTNAAVVCTPTAKHEQNANALIRAGHRVLLEKPMTEHLVDDREFALTLDTYFPNAVMLAFQRRFDAPLQYAKELLDSGAIGRVFKYVSILEDSDPTPAGYKSGGILKDMAVHNVDEVLWLSGRLPTAGASGGSTVYSRKLAPSDDEYDDAFLYLWFESELMAQIFVSRNHVSGYRIETWAFGEEGQVHIGRFEQEAHRVVVEAYGRKKPIARRDFEMPVYGDSVPEFVDRFGPAYKEEVRAFVRCCASSEPFPVNHHDGLRAMEIIEAAMECRWTPDQAAPIAIRNAGP